MVVDAKKKTGSEAGKWQEHMEKKTKSARPVGGEAEIYRPAKKEPVKPVETRAVVKKIVEGHAVDGKSKVVEGHAVKKSADARTYANQAAAHVAQKHAEKKIAGGIKPLKEEGAAHAGHGHDEKGKIVAPAHAGKDDGKKAADQAGAKADSRKDETAKKKARQKSRKVIAKKSAAVAKMRGIALHKKGLPVFRGRFGKRNIRRKSIARWDKWRVPRGIDVKREISDGYMPRIGYGLPRELRHLHPSGYSEFKVNTISGLESVPENHAVRIAAGIGRRKKLALVDKAIERGLWVLNP